MAKLSYSEQQLADLIARNPELVLEDDGSGQSVTAQAAVDIEAAVEAVEPHELTIRFIPYDDYEQPPYTLVTPQDLARQRPFWRVLTDIYPPRAYVLLVLVVVLLWREPFFAFIVWFVLVTFTPILGRNNE